MGAILLAGENLFVSDIPLILGSTVAAVVLIGVLVGVRRAVAGQQLRDFLGITATFIGLSWFGWLMIVGEHALG